MKGAFYTGSPLLEIREVPVGEPGSKDVLIKVDTATVCGTDVHIVAGEYFSRPPVILGHEFSGYVEQVGKDVTHVKPGQLVTVEPHEYCGVCKYCHNGMEHLCLNKHAFGSYYNGGFAQYALVPDYVVYPVPEGMSPQEASLAEVTGCCIHGVDRSGVKSGDTVVILGGSAVGILFVKLMRLAGAVKIIVSEPNPQRRKTVMEYGADLAVDPSQVEEAVKEHTGGLGADVVVECSGIPKVAQQGVFLAGKGGTLLIFGVAPPGQTMELEPNLVFGKELSIVGSNINPFTHRRAVELLPRLDVKGIITHTFPLEEINQAIAATRDGIGLKIAVRPNG